MYMRTFIAVCYLFVVLVLVTQHQTYADNFSNTTGIGHFGTASPYLLENPSARRLWPKFSPDRNGSRPPAPDYFYGSPVDLDLLSVVINLPLLKAIQSQLAIIQTPTTETSPSSQLHAPGAESPQSSRLIPANGPFSESPRPFNREDRQDDDDPPSEQFPLPPPGFTNWNQVLLSAAENGWDHMILQALSNGADINTHNNEGQSPLQLAAINLHVSTAILLIDRGASLTDLDNDGSNIVDIIMDSLLTAQWEDEEEATSLTTILTHLQNTGGQPHSLDPFMWFAIHSSGIAQTALEQQGLQIAQLHLLPIPSQSDEEDEGNVEEEIEELWEVTPLHIATILGSPDVVELLCQQGFGLVNTQATNYDSGTYPYPLNIAASTGDQAMVSCLLAYGAAIWPAHLVALGQMAAEEVESYDDLDRTMCQSPLFFIFFQSHNHSLQQQAVQTMLAQQVHNNAWLFTDYYISQSQQTVSFVAPRVIYQLIANAIRTGDHDEVSRRLATGIITSFLEPGFSPYGWAYAPSLVSLACARNNWQALVTLLNNGVCISWAEAHSRNFMSFCCRGLTSTDVIQHVISPEQQYYHNSENHSVLIYIFAHSNSLALRLMALSHLTQCHCQRVKTQQLITNVCTIANTLPMLWTSVQAMQFQSIGLPQNQQGPAISTGVIIDIAAELPLVSVAYHQQAAGHVSSLKHLTIAFLLFQPFGTLEELIQLIHQYDMGDVNNPQ